MSMQTIRRCCAAFAFAMLAACGTQGAPATQAANAPPEVQVSEYRLGSGDTLRISVFARPELSGEFLIGPQGTIAFPLLGDVVVSGNTLTQLTNTLAERLRQGYVRDPSVNVEVRQYRPFFILGEVGDPGTYPYTPNLTVMSAVATAGGFSYRANSRRVYIQHAGDQVESEYTLTSTTPVQPGDTVRIPERRF